MSRSNPTLATLFAAGAFVAASAVPVMAATSLAPAPGTRLAEAGCGSAHPQGAKNSKCGKNCACHQSGKAAASKKGTKDASCGKGSCGSKKG